MREIPTGIETSSKHYSFSEIFQLFENSDYGKTLSTRIRYERYIPTGMDNREWIHLLGADVNNLEHMRLTYGLACQFIKHCNNPISHEDTQVSELTRFDKNESELLLLSAIVHDWGEAVVGDKMFDLKTTQDEIEEESAFSKIINQLVTHDIDLREKINYVSSSILSDKTSKLGRAFNTIERLGYLRTGIRAMHLQHESEEVRHSLRWLSNNVLFNQIPTLLEYSLLYAPVKEFLDANQTHITNAFNLKPEFDFTVYGDEQAESNREKFNRARTRWFAIYPIGDIATIPIISRVHTIVE